MNIYIAGPFSTDKEREALKHMVFLVKKMYVEANIYVPMDFKVPGDFQKEDGTWNLPNHEWADEVFKNDLINLHKADLVFALYVGHYCSSGTIWEVGYANGIGVPVVIYIPKWAKDKDVSLMVMNSCSYYLEDTGVIHPITNLFLSQFNQK